MNATRDNNKDHEVPEAGAPCTLRHGFGYETRLFRPPASYPRRHRRLTASPIIENKSLILRVFALFVRTSLITRPHTLRPSVKYPYPVSGGTNPGCVARVRVRLINYA